MVGVAGFDLEVGGLEVWSLGTGGRSFEKGDIAMDGHLEQVAEGER